MWCSDCEGGSRFLRNVGAYVTDYVTLHLRTLASCYQRNTAKYMLCKTKQSAALQLPRFERSRSMALSSVAFIA
jgi:hypothetical protein